MMPTERLEEEHQVILKMLEIGRAMSEEIGGVDAETLGSVIDFIRTFADRCHHAKEEKVLFVEAEKHGVPKEGGPIGMMLVEHDEGRGYVKAMAEALKKIKGGDKKAAAAYRENLLKFAELLETHIRKENQILYPMINMHLPPELQAGILKKFDKMEKEEVGEGAHEKYRALVEKLEKKFL